MKEKWQKWINKIKSIFTLLTHGKTVKGARITYAVVWNLFLLTMTVVILGGAFAAGVGAGYFASLVKDEPVRSYESMKKDIYNYTETSELYFDHNVYLGKLRTDLEREEVSLDQVSDYLIKAIVATEDEYFYQHHGVVPKAVLRALFQEVTNSSVQSGGSTLTQQLIKNQILTNEVSFQRKANEILLALRLEKFFSKKEILEAYLNVSTFGRNSSGKNIAGVQAAAKGIFGKRASELTLAQAAFIAGLPQSPFGYTPFTNEGTVKKHLEPGLSRMKTVLKRMYDGGYISEKQYKEASAYDITKDFIPRAANPIEKYPWLTFEIENRAKEVLMTVLAQKDGYSEKDLKKDDSLYYKYKTLAAHDLRQNGYKIYTTIDKKIYDAMQKVKDRYQWYGPNKPDKIKDPDTGEWKTVMEPVQVGAMLIENKTGKIISFVGGRKYDSEHQLNHATNAIRQNGSTMKPLLIYAPAIELGKASPGTPLPDVALSLNPASSSPWPHNYDYRYSGLVSARYALAKSYNVPAVKLYKEIVNQRPAKYLEKMGFTSLTKADYTNLAASIGSLTNGVTIEENTNAFSTFANGGQFIDAYLIDKIVDKNGKVIYQHKAKPVKVFTPQTAYLTLDMMRDVIKMGTAAGLRSKLIFNADWAGKTGTGNQYIDSWFVATNPNVTFGLWRGYDKPKSLQTYGMSYSQRTNTLWAQLMNAAYKIRPDLVAPKQSFKMPGGIVRRSYCAVSGLLPSAACAKAGLVESDYFKVNNVPTKVDDSLIEGQYVTIGDKKYLALPSTPKEFAQVGLILNPDFIRRMVGPNFHNYSQLIPQRDRWGKVLVSTARLADNGKKPNPVSLKASGNTLSWSQASDKDVVGYRIYRGGAKVGSIVNGSKRSFTAGNGAYYVTAVDIAGNESAPSNLVEIGTGEKPKDQPVTGKPGEKSTGNPKDKPAGKDNH
ncbi:transglycosylase domain-containing protein [Neobacillus sp. OS1-32]|uniref:Penicillin-binding protein n=1 Tax=Neobacillus paridis TaxID=2803862 RepID=A0ABS1TKU1_9BACI|nr:MULTISPECIES: transglycosylase domain-containing protein [Neobacillus]MBL4951935.1 penicillin-binding protein [Neobacillus paridis]WML32315.1 transglycosylase domain-containing protein [Neobacillus sp. OS1-32]